MAATQVNDGGERSEAKPKPKAQFETRDRWGWLFGSFGGILPKLSGAWAYWVVQGRAGPCFPSARLWLAHCILLPHLERQRHRHRPISAV